MLNLLGEDGNVRRAILDLFKEGHKRAGGSLRRIFVHEQLERGRQFSNQSVSTGIFALVAEGCIETRDDRDGLLFLSAEGEANL